MRRTLITLALSSFLSVPLTAAAGAPREEATDAHEHHAKMECTCKPTALDEKGASDKTAKAAATPSEFVRNVWTSP